MSETKQDREEWVSVYSIIGMKNEIFDFDMPKIHLQKDGYAYRSSVDALLTGLAGPSHHEAYTEVIYYVHHKAGNCDLCFSVQFNARTQDNPTKAWVYAWKQRDVLISRMEGFLIEQTSGDGDRNIFYHLRTCVSDYIYRATGRFW